MAQLDYLINIDIKNKTDFDRFVRQVDVAGRDGKRFAKSYNDAEDQLGRFARASRKAGDDVSNLNKRISKVSSRKVDIDVKLNEGKAISDARSLRRRIQRRLSNIRARVSGVDSRGTAVGGGVGVGGGGTDTVDGGGIGSLAPALLLARTGITAASAALIASLGSVAALAVGISNVLENVTLNLNKWADALEISVPEAGILETIMRERIGEADWGALGGIWNDWLSELSDDDFTLQGLLGLTKEELEGLNLIEVIQAFADAGKTADDFAEALELPAEDAGIIRRIWPQLVEFEAYSADLVLQGRIVSEGIVEAAESLQKTKVMLADLPLVIINAVNRSGILGDNQMLTPDGSLRQIYTDITRSSITTGFRNEGNIPNALGALPYSNFPYLYNGFPVNFEEYQTLFYHNRNEPLPPTEGGSDVMVSPYDAMRPFRRNDRPLTREEYVILRQHLPITPLPPTEGGSDIMVDPLSHPSNFQRQAMANAVSSGSLQEALENAIHGQDVAITGTIKLDNESVSAIGGQIPSSPFRRSRTSGHSRRY